MQLSFTGLAISQESRPANGNYPASVNVTFVEAGTGNTLVVSSPVAIDPTQLLTPIDWTLSGFSTRPINYRDKNTQEAKVFVKNSCAGITGVLRSKG